MDYDIIWIIFLVGFCATLLIMSIINQNNVSNIKKYQESINKQILHNLKNAKFNISKILYINDYATYNQNNSTKKMAIIDNENKKLALIDYKTSSLFIIEFNEILGYEIYDNGSTTTTGGALGGFGYGIYNAETSGICKDLRIIIRLKKFDKSQIVYDIIFNTPFNIGFNKSTKIYKECIVTLQEFVSFLEVVKNNNSQ